MTWSQVRTHWPHLAAQGKERWTSLSDRAIAEVAGHRHRLVAAVVEAYAVGEEQARDEVDAFVRGLQVITR